MPGGGAENKGDLATTSLEFKFHLQFPCGSPSIELSNVCQSARSENERESKETLKNTWHLRQSAFRIDLFDADI